LELGREHHYLPSLGGSSSSDTTLLEGSLG
jgi:hypothetical protein